MAELLGVLRPFSVSAGVGLSVAGPLYSSSFEGEYAVDFEQCENDEERASAWRRCGGYEWAW